MSRFTRKARIGMCVDPYNKHSADLMKQQLEKDGAEVVIIKDYPKYLAAMSANGDAVSFHTHFFDGLVVMGNDKYDIDPLSYLHRYPDGDPRKQIHKDTVSEAGATSTDISRARSKYESHLIREALRRKIPLLGICGGMQRINLICGEEEPDGKPIGTLIQHLPEVVGDERHSADFSNGTASQEVTVAGGTRLAGMIHADEPFDPKYIGPMNSAPEKKIKVSTRHHQAIDQIADGLKVSAFTRDIHPVHGTEHITIKAFEADPNGKYKGRFIMGTQFHPEYVRDHHLCEALAARMVEKAKEYKRHKPREKDLNAQPPGTTPHPRVNESGRDQEAGRWS